MRFTVPRSRLGRMRSSTRLSVTLVTVAGLVASCGGSSDGDAKKATDSTSRATSESTTKQAETSAPKVIDLSALGPCDPIAPRCLVPYPNDFYTEPAADTDTGRRLRFDRESMPANAAGVHIDPTEWTRNDGFSPSSSMIVLFPGVVLESSNLPDSAHIADSLDDEAGAVVFDLATGEKRAFWAELDAQTDDASAQLLFLRPAELFEEGHTYGVALRGLRDSADALLAAPDGFVTIRDRAFSSDRLFPRAEALDQVLDAADKHFGWERDEVQLAWSFTVASERNLSERMLAMRDAALKQVDATTPAFTVDPPLDGLPDSGILRVVTGTFEVPNFLTGKGEPGSALNNGSGPDANPIPQQNGTFQAPFTCVIPRVALGDGDTTVPTAVALYGHGLLGSRDEVRGAAPDFAAENAITFCATDWKGMSDEDVPNAAAILGDLSGFRTLADRLQQGMLNFLVLGRLLKADDGLVSHEAFQDSAGNPLIATDGELLFVGNSQGGIIGGALSAVAQDWTRVVLGVPGVAYHVLLNRSIDWDEFKVIYDAAYTDPIDRQLGLLLIQSLWDRGENAGYAQHLVDDPYPDTPKKNVAIFEAYSDQQVANVQTEVLARTLGARAHTPLLDPDRELANGGEGYGLKPISGREDGGAFIFQWDFGNPPPPLDNQAPREGEDPHGRGGDVAEVRAAIGAFLATGALPADLCGGEACASAALPEAFTRLDAPPWVQETRETLDVGDALPELGEPQVVARDVLADTPNLGDVVSIESDQLPYEIGDRVLIEAHASGGAQIGLYALADSDAGVDGVFVITESGAAYAYDLSQWLLPPTTKPDAEFVDESVRWVELSGDVLYIANSHWTYSADTGGANSYISAIDVATGKLLWRSEPLVSNAKNFLIVGSGIVAGYGFTDEPDRVVVIDRATGKVTDEVAVPSGPEQLADRGDQILVRCYDADVHIPLAALAVEPAE